MAQSHVIINMSLLLDAPPADSHNHSGYNWGFTKKEYRLRQYGDLRFYLKINLYDVHNLNRGRVVRALINLELVYFAPTPQAIRLG